MENNHENVEQHEIEKISQTYGLFSTIFLGEWEKLLSLLSNHNKIDDGHFLSFLNSLRDTDPMELKIQYDNLFVAPGYYFASPYQESYNLSENQIRSNLGALYEQSGLLGLCEEKGELPDHIGCVLGYMQGLVHLEKLALEENNKDRLDQLRKLELGFIEAHLQWVHSLKNAVAKKLEYGFILDALEQLQSFIQYHHEELTLVNNQ